MEMEELMAQARELQDKVSAAQEKLNTVRIKGVAQDGACVMDMTGKYDLIGLKLSDEVVSQGAVAVSRAVTAAYRDAKEKIDKIIDEIMGDATQGMSLPN